MGDVLEATKYYISNRNGAVKIRSLDGKKTFVPRSIPQQFRDISNSHREQIAYVYKNGDTGPLTFLKLGDYLSSVETIATALISIGLTKLQSVAILSENCSEWAISFVAAIFAGGIGAALNPNDSNRDCVNKIKSIKPQVIIVQNDNQLKKISAIKEKVASLIAVIQIEGTPKEEDVLSWDDLMEIGKKASGIILKKSLEDIKINQCCGIVFTEGNTGISKAVMLSHINIDYQVNTVNSQYLIKNEDKIFNCMPFYEITGLVWNVFGPILNPSGVIYFAKQENILNFIREVQPTILLLERNIGKKLQEMIIDSYKKPASCWTSLCRHYALEVSSQRYKILQNGFDCTSYKYFDIPKDLVYEPIAKSLGLNRVKFSILIRENTPQNISRWLLAANVITYEVCSLPETTGLYLINTPYNFKYETDGYAPNGTVIKRVNCNGKGQFEINGPLIFMGYLNNEASTKISFNSSNPWLRVPQS